MPPSIPIETIRTIRRLRAAGRSIRDIARIVEVHTETVVKYLRLGSSPEDNPYGYCPTCGAPGEHRTTRRFPAEDTCSNGHRYPSERALALPSLDKPSA